MVLQHFKAVCVVFALNTAVAAALLGWCALGWTGVLIAVIALGAIADRMWYALKKAGPRTTRPVPPQRIAYCQQLSAMELSKAYRQGTLRCVDVVATYIQHIKRVNPYINALVFECFDEAMQDAIKADEVWAAWRANRSLPRPSWLLGVPCTVKECMECAGCPNSSGHPARMHLISTRDSPVVKNFREAGAIILGVTNISELCMWYESSNYVYGITCNPYDTRRMVGGSSGGEGSAAGAAFSTFSLGSDIGGSIRMPAAFNGVVGHKASPHYISNRGQHPGAKTSANHYMTTGPITRFPEDVIPLCEVAARGGFLEDPVEYPPCQPLKKLLNLAHRRLRVYALEDFGSRFITVSPSEIQAVHDAADWLSKNYGAEVIYVNVGNRRRCTGGRVPEPFQRFPKSVSMWIAALTSDPSETKFTELMAEGNGGPVSWTMEVFRWLLGRSQHTLPAIMLCLLENMESILPGAIAMGSGRSLDDFRSQLEELLGEDGVIICPSFPTAAPRHHRPLFNPMQFQYTAIFNVLQLPATAVPMWQKEIAGRKVAPSPAEGQAESRPADWHLPKSVQIVSRTHMDELSVSIAAVLAQDLGGYRYPGWATLDPAPRKG